MSEVTKDPGRMMDGWMVAQEQRRIQQRFKEISLMGGLVIRPQPDLHMMLLLMILHAWLELFDKWRR